MFRPHLKQVRPFEKQQTFQEVTDMSAFQDFTFPSTTGKNTIHALKCLPDGQPKAIV